MFKVELTCKRVCGVTQFSREEEASSVCCCSMSKFSCGGPAKLSMTGKKTSPCKKPIITKAKYIWK
jgi:hypothetical protein